MGADLLAGELVVDDHDDGRRELIERGSGGTNNGGEATKRNDLKKASSGSDGRRADEVGRLLV